MCPPVDILALASLLCFEAREGLRACLAMNGSERTFTLAQERLVVFRAAEHDLAEATRLATELGEHFNAVETL